MAYLSSPNLLVARLREGRQRHLGLQLFQKESMARLLKLVVVAVVGGTLIASCNQKTEDTPQAQSHLPPLALQNHPSSRELAGSSDRTGRHPFCFQNQHRTTMRSRFARSMELRHTQVFGNAAKSHLFEQGRAERADSGRKRKGHRN